MKDTNRLIKILKNIPMVDDTTAKILSNYWQNNIKMFAGFANKARDVGDEQLGCFYYYNHAVTELGAIVNVKVAGSICDWCRDNHDYIANALFETA